MDEVFNVVGFKFYEFKPKDSNVTYNGVKLYLVGDDKTNRDKNFFGCYVDTVNIPDRIPYDPHLGDRIIIQYNKFGKVDGVRYE